ncbi:hypothetical protein ACA910_018262 [Epithemia clementina (nom. ined.)]
MPLARMGGVGDAQGPDAWFQSLPIITRYWFGTSLAVTLAVNFQIIPILSVIYDWDSMVTKLQLWRLLSSFLYIGKFEFNTLIALMLLVQFSQRYEQMGPFNTGAGGGTADYCFMLMILMVTVLVTYPLMLMVAPIPPIFARNVIYGVLYVWSKRHPSSQANIWGIPIPAIYLPFAYVVFTVFLGGAYMDMLHGMAAGHLYYFLAEVVPQVQGRDVLQTPQFLLDRFGVGLYNEAQGAAAVAADVPRAGGIAPVGGQAQTTGGGGGHNWGGGRPLGRE